MFYRGEKNFFDNMMSKTLFVVATFLCFSSALSQQCSSIRKARDCRRTPGCDWQQRQCITAATVQPTPSPTRSPTPQPTPVPPTPSPTNGPTGAATSGPTAGPTPPPTPSPTMAPAPVVSNFNIQLVNAGSPDTNPIYIQAFEDAKARWESIIVEDQINFQEASVYGVSDWFLGRLSVPYSGPIDDLVIGYEIAEIDGASGTLGSAGPVYTQTGTSRALSGTMKFDVVDFDNYVAKGDIDSVRSIILHEMGHVLGLVGVLGTCASRCGNQLSDLTVFYDYECTKASMEYELLVPGGTLRLENNGGGGTVCSHFEESNFNTATSSELMTGWFEANLGQPISRVTVAALDDLNSYGRLNYNAADPWPAPASGRRAQGNKKGRTWDILHPKSTFYLPDLMGDEGPIYSVDPVPIASVKGKTGVSKGLGVPNNGGRVRKLRGLDE